MVVSLMVTTGCSPSCSDPARRAPPLARCDDRRARHGGAVHVRSLLIGLYLGQSSMGSTYGAAGSVMILLLWVYYSCQILLFGAEFTRMCAQRLGTKPAPEAFAEKDPDAVTTARSLYGASACLLARIPRRRPRRYRRRHRRPQRRRFLQLPPAFLVFFDREIDRRHLRRIIANDLLERPRPLVLARFLPLDLAREKLRRQRIRIVDQRQ